MLRITSTMLPENVSITSEDVVNFDELMGDFEDLVSTHGDTQPTWRLEFADDDRELQFVFDHYKEFANQGNAELIQLAQVMFYLERDSTTVNCLKALIFFEDNDAEDTIDFIEDEDNSFDYEFGETENEAYTELGKSIVRNDENAGVYTDYFTDEMYEKIARAEGADCVPFGKSFVAFRTE